MSNPYYPRQQQDEVEYYSQQQQPSSSSRAPFDPHRRPSYSQQPNQFHTAPEPPSQQQQYDYQAQDGQALEQWRRAPQMIQQQQHPYAQQEPQQQYPYANAEQHYDPYSQPIRSDTVRTWNSIPHQSPGRSGQPPSPGEDNQQSQPLDWDKLTPEQRKIAESFPKDLDEEGSTMRSSVTKMLKGWRDWVKWRYWYYYVTFIVLAVLVAMFSIYHRDIIDWLTPISKKVNSVAWGWVIPVAILFVISFPPLFGQEVVGILCGVVYPFWEAFGILSLGTLLGELGNFVAFRWCLKGVATKYERKSLNYACMAHIVREGGFMVILIARLSAIPGHFTTAVFATVGMNIFIFTLAAILSLPKQLAVVYIGRAIAESGTGEETTQSKIIKYVVLVVSGIITILAAVYLYRKMEQARPIVQARLRQKRYTMLSEATQDQLILPAARVEDDIEEMHGSSGGYSKPALYESEGQGPTTYPPVINERSSSHRSQPSRNNGSGRRQSWNPFAGAAPSQPQEAYPQYPAYEQRQGMLSQAAPMAATSSASLLPGDYYHPPHQDRELAPTSYQTTATQLHREGDISITQDYEHEHYPGQAL